LIDRKNWDNIKRASAEFGDIPMNVRREERE
jgi:hypothetical protein